MLCLFKIFSGHEVIFVGPLITLCYVFIDVSLGFQSQGGPLACMLSRLPSQKRKPMQLPKLNRK